MTDLEQLKRCQKQARRLITAGWKVGKPSTTLGAIAKATKLPPAEIHRLFENYPGQIGAEPVESVPMERWEVWEGFDGKE